VDSLSAFSPALHHGVATIINLGLTERSAEAAVSKAVVGQAYLLSTLDLFYLFGWTVLLLIPICWIARRPAGGVVTAGGE
jgi:DHA2 family multidrug resistance protein